ncbi:putative nitrate reductase molybdenum cofactor assembly chaperone NarW [Klebsiella pneumoniae]|nr:putative nitrate reductase molybdenum cofactor assembly chaperone NarW [Klebsiella pneumoniae]
MCMPNPATAAAMVDLMNQYQQAGLQIDCRELPDHLPLYLEYLSILPPAEARGLQNIAPILALIGGRLKQRACPYYQLFDARWRWLKAAHQ